jgi:hypothetical protein
MEEVQFFTTYSKDIAEAKSSVRLRLIAQLTVENPPLAKAWANYCREIEGFSSLIRASGLFPNTGRGKFNLAGLFVERAASLAAQFGMVGILVPTAIATDEAGKLLFDRLVSQRRVLSLYDFENREGLFPEVDSRYRFSLFSIAGTSRTQPGFDCSFGLTAPAALSDRGRHLTITADDIANINPNSRTCPVVKDLRDFFILSICHKHHGVLIRSQPPSNPWGAVPTFMFQMSDTEGRFEDLSGVEIDSTNSEGHCIDVGGQRAEVIRLYEAKLIHQFDHRYATFAGQTKIDCDAGNAREIPAGEKGPYCFTATRFWITEAEFKQKIASRPAQGKWLLSYREIARATDARTLIAAVIPFVAAGRKIPQLYTGADAKTTSCLLAVLNSLAMDFVVRCKLSGTSIGNFFLEQLPVPAPSAFDMPLADSTLKEWIAQRVLELTYSAWDLEPFAQDCGWSGSPFRWEAERRFLLRCELDGAFFHLYLPANANGDWRPSEGETTEDLVRLKASFPAPRDAVAYIMDTFPIVKRKDEEKWGDYRTKRVILEIYDAMAESIRTGHPYQTRLDPPPADPRCCHPLRERL